MRRVLWAVGMPDAATQSKIDVTKLFGLSDEQATPKAIHEARQEGLVKGIRGGTMFADGFWTEGRNLQELFQMHLIRAITSRRYFTYDTHNYNYISMSLACTCCVVAPYIFFLFLSRRSTPVII